MAGTYNVSTPEELIEALKSWDAEVICEENAIFDFSGLSAQRINLNAGIVRGNGAKIQNMTILQVLTSRSGKTPETTINDLTIENAYVTPNTGFQTKESIFSVDYTSKEYTHTINFNNCVISIHTDEYTRYVGKTYSNAGTTATRKARMNFFACAVNIVAENSEFKIGSFGGYYRDFGEAIVSFDCCNLRVNMPTVTGGRYATDCYHKKCLIYYYMPAWNGYAEIHSGGSASITNGLIGEQYESCIVRGNLTNLNAADDITPNEATTENKCALIATLGGSYYNHSGDWHLRRGTEADVRNVEWLLAPAIGTGAHFNLITENPSNTDWQHDDFTNDGIPFIAVFPNIIRVKPIKRPKNKLRIFDMMSSKPQLTTNGLAILDATDAQIHEILNGEYSLTFSHPIDKNGKWRYIREANIVRCQGQYFTIVSCVWRYDSKNNGIITANCEHIFYQNNDLWIYPDDIPNISYYTAKSAMDAIMSAARHFDDGAMMRYVYEWASDWSFSAPYMLVNMDEGFTPINGLLGENGIIGVMGGELYRDNFYFSINDRMENAKDNAFDIRFGNNAAGIKRTVDASTLCTNLTLRDTETGAWVSVSYSNDGYPLFQFPHTIARSKNYTFNQAVYDEIESQGLNILDYMYPILMHIWETSCTPILCYEVDLADYQIEGVDGIKINQEYKVGDSGRIHDSLLDVDISIRITETEKDGLTGKTTKVVFGSKHSFTRASGYPKPFDGKDTPVIKSALLLRDNAHNSIKDKDGNQIYVKVVM